MSEQARAEYELREKAWRDRMAQMDYAYDDGLAKGIEKGREEGRTEERLETARKLKAIGLPAEQIAAVTGLSPEVFE